MTKSAQGNTCRLLDTHSGTGSLKFGDKNFKIFKYRASRITLMKTRLLFLSIAPLVLLANYPAFALWEQPKGIELIIQIQVRDSDGTLVSYIEGKPRIYDLDKLVQWLETQSQKSTITKNGKHYEILRSSYESGSSETNTKGGYFVKLPVNGVVDYVMYLDHGSYHVRPGDMVKAYFTLIRPA